MGLTSPAQASQTAAGISAIAEWTRTVTFGAGVVHRPLGIRLPDGSRLRFFAHCSCPVLASKIRAAKIGFGRPLSSVPRNRLIGRPNSRDKMRETEMRALHLAPDRFPAGDAVADRRAGLGRDPRRCPRRLQRGAGADHQRAELCRQDVAHAGRTAARAGFAGIEAGVHPARRQRDRRRHPAASCIPSSNSRFRRNCRCSATPLCCANRSRRKPSTASRRQNTRSTRKRRRAARPARCGSAATASR